MVTNEFSIPKNSTSNILHVFISTSTYGAAKTGLLYNTASLRARYVTPAGTVVTLTLEDITTLGTYQAPTSAAHLRFKEVDITNMPGLYELHVPDGWFSSTYRWLTLQIGGVIATGECLVRLRIPVANDYDGQRLGLTCLPAADFGKTGGFDSPVVSENLAQTGSSQSVTLAAGDSAVTDAYMGMPIVIASGAGAGQVRICIAYNGTTKVATVDQPWATVPDATSRYRVLGLRDVPMDGSLGVVVQALEGNALASIWGYATSNLTVVGSIGKYIVDQAESLMGANAIETGWNIVQAVRVMLAVLAGNLSGGGTSTNYIRNVTNTKDRVNATVDANGNRTTSLVDGD